MHFICLDCKRNVYLRICCSQKRTKKLVLKSFEEGNKLTPSPTLSRGAHENVRRRVQTQWTQKVNNRSVWQRRRGTNNGTLAILES